jgi:hypothetical protein
MQFSELQKLESEKVPCTFIATLRHLVAIMPVEKRKDDENGVPCCAY